MEGHPGGWGGVLGAGGEGIGGCYLTVWNGVGWGAGSAGGGRRGRGAGWGQEEFGKELGRLWVAVS